MKQTIPEYIFQYLNDCEYRYQIYDLVSSVELHFNISFNIAKTKTMNELRQLGEL